MPERRIFAAVPRQESLDSRQRALKQALLDRIARAGYQPVIFNESGIATRQGWSVLSVKTVIRKCIGAAVLAFPRWRFLTAAGEKRFISELAQYEGAVADAFGLPLFIIAEEKVAERALIWPGGGNPTLVLPEHADTSWFDSEQFITHFNDWVKSLNECRDVFLGYSGGAADTAKLIRQFLSSELDLSVLDWSADFVAGRSILDEIQRAARLCRCGIFLFTKDDLVNGETAHASPRDNVIFESGYFAGARGQDNIMIVLEEGAKLPVDMSGRIHAILKDRSDTQPIHEKLRMFIERIL